MSSDNRTNAIIQRRVVNRQTNIRQPRKCSFCSGIGHNITQCNDGRFMVFELICIQQKQLVQNLSTNVVSIIPSQEFISRLILYSIGNTSRMVKAYAVRKCGATTRDNVFTCIEKIATYIFNLTEESNYLVNDENFQTPNIYNMINGMMLLELSNTLMQPHIQPHIQKFKIESVLDLTDEICDANVCNSECNICYESKMSNEFVKLNCSHSFCGKCIETTLKMCTDNTGPSCALCREPIQVILSKDVNIANSLAEYILS
jgi:hypothetical protein